MKLGLNLLSGLGSGSASTPYGLAYGLGQAGSDIAQGMLKGQMMAPHLQAQDIANQQAGLNLQKSQYQLGGEQAANQALGNEIAGTDWSPDQYKSMEQMADAYDSAGINRAQAGRGDSATNFFQQASQLRQKAQNMRLTKFSQYSQTGNIEGMKQLAPDLGYGPVSDIEKDEDGNYVFKNDKGDTTATIPQEELNLIGATPGERANYLVKKYAAKTTAESRKAVAETGAKSRENVASTAAQSREDVANINALSRQNVQRLKEQVGGDRATAIQKNVSGYANVLASQGYDRDTATRMAWEKFLPGSGAASTAATKGAIAARDNEIKRLTESGAEDVNHPDHALLQSYIADRAAQAKTRNATTTPAPASATPTSPRVNRQQLIRDAKDALAKGADKNQIIGSAKKKYGIDLTGAF